MNTKHTPGPWLVSKMSKSTILKDIYIRGGNERIARVVVPDTAQSIEEYEANARLIAAAPDLLEALKVIELAVRMGASFGKSLSNDSECLVMARAAIAKATGDQ